MNRQYYQRVVLCWLFVISFLSKTDSVSITKVVNASLWPETTSLAPNFSSTSASPVTLNSSSDISFITTGSSQHGVMTDLTSEKPLSFETGKQRIISSPPSITTSTGGSHQVTSASNNGNTKDPGGSIESGFLWKGVSIGLGSLCVVVILAFTVTLAILCRLRGLLKRMRTMLYPPDEEHVYDKLGTVISKSKVTENGKITKSDSSNKLSVKVELKPLQVRVDQEMLDDEEIHSPMSPEPPPISSLISSKIPSPNIQAASNISERDNTSPVNTETIAYTNEAFDNDKRSEPKNNAYPNDEKNTTCGKKDDEKTDITGLPDEDTDDEDLYEKYTYTATEAKQVNNTYVKHTMSFPIMTEKMDDIHRQNSLSGLPESLLHRVNSQLGADGMPLQDVVEDFTAHFDSGIPGGQNSIVEELNINEGKRYENRDYENEKAENSYLNRSESNQMETFESNQMDKIGSIDATANGGGVLKASSSVGFDIPKQCILNEHTYEDSVYDNEDGGVPFDPFDEYMTPISGIQKDPNIVIVNNRIAENDGSNNMFITDVEYEDVDGVPFRDEVEDVDGVPFRDEVNKQNIFNSSGGSIQDGPPKLEPLVMLKSEQLRLRTDSSSTPDNYYLDLDEELPELKVEESKRISSQFSSDFYIRNLGSVEKLSNFDDKFETNFTLEISSGLQISSAYQNEGPIYQNFVFSDDTEVFGNESTT